MFRRSPSHTEQPRALTEVYECQDDLAGRSDTLRHAQKVCWGPTHDDAGNEPIATHCKGVRTIGESGSDSQSEGYLLIHTRRAKQL